MAGYRVRCYLVCLRVRRLRSHGIVLDSVRLDRLVRHLSNNLLEGVLLVRCTARGRRHHPVNVEPDSTHDPSSHGTPVPSGHNRPCCHLDRLPPGVVAADRDRRLVRSVVLRRCVEGVRWLSGDRCDSHLALGAPCRDDL